MKPDGIYAAMVPGSTSEFWAVVGTDHRPVPPYARSKEEFELKLAAEGMALTGKEITPAEAGLPAGFCAAYRIRTFEVGSAEGSE